MIPGLNFAVNRLVYGCCKLIGTDEEMANAASVVCTMNPLFMLLDPIGSAAGFGLNTLKEKELSTRDSDPDKSKAYKNAHDAASRVGSVISPFPGNMKG